MMNVKNAPVGPSIILSKKQRKRLAGQTKLLEQFPVSSGSQHRTKESECVPVPPKKKMKEKQEDKVFQKPSGPMQNWALNRQVPGQFTGTTGAKLLSVEELSAGQQAWARKGQLKQSAPVRPRFGLKMLQKMGWSPGQGLGKNKEGSTQPLLIDVKVDKTGFHAQEEVTRKKLSAPMVKDVSGKHPVSALVELCTKNNWEPPEFEIVYDSGPDHHKKYLMKVIVNGQEFKPAMAASSKKIAKANAAAAYFQLNGLSPKEPGEQS